MIIKIEHFHDLETSGLFIQLGSFNLLKDNNIIIYKINNKLNN